jgi:hypothetical protein
MQNTSTSCDSSEHWINNVSFVGISSAKTWTFDVTSATSASDCCNICYGVTSGCNGWLFVPHTDQGLGTSCTYIHGNDGSNKDSQCPSGKPDMAVGLGKAMADNWGGTGPCTGKVH